MSGQEVDPLPVLPPGVVVVGRGLAGDTRLVDERGVLRPVRGRGSVAEGRTAPAGWVVLGPFAP